MDNTIPQVEIEAIESPAPKKRESTKSVDPGPENKLNQKSEAAPVQNKDAAKESASSKQKVSPATLDGAHLVVAGNFLERSNAEKHLKSIKELGYTDAEILNFEISQYYTVVAGRYDDLAEARRVAKKLKDLHAIDTYVRNGN